MTIVNSGNTIPEVELRMIPVTMDGLFDPRRKTTKKGQTSDLIYMFNSMPLPWMKAFTFLNQCHSPD